MKNKKLILQTTIFGALMALLTFLPIHRAPAADFPEIGIVPRDGGFNSTDTQATRFPQRFYRAVTP